MEQDRKKFLEIWRKVYDRRIVRSDGGANFDLGVGCDAFEQYVEQERQVTREQMMPPGKTDRIVMLETALSAANQLCDVLNRLLNVKSLATMSDEIKALVKEWHDGPAQAFKRCSEDKEMNDGQ